MICKLSPPRGNSLALRMNWCVVLFRRLNVTRRWHACASESHRGFWSHHRGDCYRPARWRAAAWAAWLGFAAMLCGQGTPAERAAPVRPQGLAEPARDALNRARQRAQRERRHCARRGLPNDRASHGPFNFPRSNYEVRSKPPESTATISLRVPGRRRVLHLTHRRMGWRHRGSREPRGRGRVGQ